MYMLAGRVWSYFKKIISNYILAHNFANFTNFPNFLADTYPLECNLSGIFEIFKIGAEMASKIAKNAKTVFCKSRPYTSTNFVEIWYVNSLDHFP